jgi:hypothetical protein
MPSTKKHTCFHSEGTDAIAVKYYALLCLHQWWGQATLRLKEASFPRRWSSAFIISPILVRKQQITNDEHGIGRCNVHLVQSLILGMFAQEASKIEKHPSD